MSQFFEMVSKINELANQFGYELWADPSGMSAFSMRRGDGEFSRGMFLILTPTGEAKNLDFNAPTPGKIMEFLAGDR